VLEQPQNLHSLERAVSIPLLWENMDNRAAYDEWIQTAKEAESRGEDMTVAKADKMWPFDPPVRICIKVVP
jgi:hypothetical protein